MALTTATQMLIVQTQLEVFSASVDLVTLEMGSALAMVCKSVCEKEISKIAQLSSFTFFPVNCAWKTGPLFICTYIKKLREPVDKIIIPTLSYSEVDECIEDIDNCHTNADCVNTAGSFQCSCIAGYSGDGVDDCNGQF